MKKIILCLLFTSVLLHANYNDQLIDAAKDQSVDSVKFLIKNGADINYKNNEGQTALIIATKNENLKVMKYLINQNADMSIKDNYGKTVLNYYADEPEMMKILGPYLHTETSRSEKKVLEAKQEKELFIDSYSISDKNEKKYLEIVRQNMPAIRYLKSKFAKTGYSFKDKKVSVAIGIAANGMVLNSNISKSSGNEAFDKELKMKFKRYRFPETKDGEDINITFGFGI